MNDSIRVIAGIVRYELRREVKKKSFYFLVFLIMLPVFVSSIMKAADLDVIEDESLWAVILGFKTQTASTGQVSLLEIQGIANWAWLVAIFYGGDLFASDLKEGAVRLLLTRSVKRWEYVLGKMLALAILMVIAFGVAGITALIAGWILSGSQEQVLLATPLAALLGVGVIPLALLAALIGLKTRSSTLGMVLGFIVYMAVSIGISVVASVEAARETGITFDGMEAVGYGEEFVKFQAAIVEKTLRYYSYIPILAGFSLPSMIYWEATEGVIKDPILTMVGLQLDASEFALYQGASLISGIVILGLAVVWLIYRLDL